MTAAQKPAARSATSSTPKPIKVEASSPLAKRAKRLGYKVPDVPEAVVDTSTQPKLVTAEPSSPAGKRAKRLGYDLPESPETVYTADVTVPMQKK